VILLAIETATLEVGAAIIGDEGPIAIERSRPGRRHVETLHPALARVFDVAGVDAAGLDAVAVDVGPGLFTGLRVGIAAAKAFGFARRLPLVEVRSTTALRTGAAMSQLAGDAEIVPVIDMRRGEVAWELPDGSLEIGHPQKLAEALRRVGGEILVVGDGALANRDELVALDPTDIPLRFGDEELAAPSVVAVGEVARSRLRSGDSTDAFSIGAVYLRAADARSNYLRRDVPVAESAR